MSGQCQGTISYREKVSTSGELKTKIIVILGVVGASLSAIFVRLSSAPAPVLVFYRIGFAALLMTVPGIKAINRERQQFTKKDIICAVISGIFLAFHFYTYFTAVKMTCIAAAVALTDVEVFFVSFAMIFFLHEKISKVAWIGIAVTFFGSMVITYGDGIKDGNLVGDLFAISSAFFVAVYTLMGRICRRHMSTASYTTIVYWVCALTALALLIIQGLSPFGYTTTDVLCGLGMTIFCTLLGHSVFSWALKTLNPAYVSTVKLLEPVFSSIIGIFLFSEIPGLFAVIGAVFVIVGVYLTGE